MAGKLAVIWILRKNVWVGNLGMITFEAAADWWPYSVTVMIYTCIYNKTTSTSFEQIQRYCYFTVFRNKCQYSEKELD